MNPFRTPGTVQQRTRVLALAPTPVVTDGVASLRLYDPIDSWGEFWGVSAKEFVAALDALPADTTEIRVLINSPGGELFEGLAILNALRAHPAKTTAVVEGIAASSASFIAAGCDELVMMKNSELFIHNAWGLVVGNAADMRESADTYDHFDRNLAQIYADKSGDPVDYWLGEMAKDKFLNDEEAVAAKLADRIEGVGDAAAARARFDLSVFARTPSELRPAASLSSPPDSSEPVDPNRKEPVAMSDTLKAGLLERLGLTDANASAETLLAAFDQAIETATSHTTTVPDGTQLIDSGVLASLQSDAAAGREAREEQNKARRDGIVAAAVAEGRIAPASSAKWRAQLDTNEDGTVELIESLAVNTIPVVEIGGADGVASPEDTLYASAWADEKEEV